jgi:hypothetical protein
MSGWQRVRHMQSEGVAVNVRDSQAEVGESRPTRDSKREGLDDIIPR